MSLTRRWLPVEEWPKLDQTELALYAPHMDPKRTRVVVVERDGRIVACWAFMRILHAEGLWIEPGASQRSVWKHLAEALTEAATEEGVQAVMTMANRDDVQSIIERHQGQLLPGQHYALGVPFGPFKES